MHDNIHINVGILVFSLYLRDHVGEPRDLLPLSPQNFGFYGLHGELQIFSRYVQLIA